MPSKPLPGTQINWLHPLSKDIIGCWLFNEGAGSKITDLANRNNGTFNTASTSNWIGGVHGRSLDFEGADNEITIPDDASLDMGNVMTFSCWINPRNDLTRQTIFGPDNETGGFQFEINVSQGMIAIIVPGIFVARTNVTEIKVNKWQHIVYTRTGTGSGTHAIYSDGVLLELETDATADFTDATNDRKIGRRSSGSQLYTGLISDIRIWKRALSFEEVKQLYINPFAMFKRPDISRYGAITGVTEVDKTFTADSILKKVDNDKTFTSDAILKKADNDKTFTADSILIQDDIDKTFTADAFLQVIDNDKTFTGNAILRIISDLTFTTDAILKKSDNDKTFTVDGILGSALDVGESRGPIRRPFPRIKEEFEFGIKANIGIIKIEEIGITIPIIRRIIKSFNFPIFTSIIKETKEEIEIKSTLDHAKLRNILKEI